MIRRVGAFLGRHARHHVRRALRWQVAARLSLLLVTLLLATLFWLAATESGARFAVAWTSAAIPNFRADYDSGTVAGPLKLERVLLKGKTRVELDSVALDWSPGRLFLGELHLLDVHVARVRIEQPPLAARPAPGTPALPTVQLPVALRVDRLAIDELVFARGDRETHYTQVDTALAWQGTQLQVDRLVIGMPHWQATLAGSLATTGEWPLESRLHFVTPRHGATTFTLDGTARGPLAGVQLALDSQGTIASHIEGEVAPLASGMPFHARLDAPSMRIPPHGAPERAATLSGIALAAHGELLGAILFDGTAQQLDTPWTQPVPVRLHAGGTWRGMDRAELTVADPRFDATLVTDYRWLDGQHFHGRLDVRRLDLALANPALASNLAGSVRIDGDIPPATPPAGGPRFDLVIETLAGPLLHRPVDIRGPLRWQDGRWHFDDLELRQGDNRAVLRGTLADGWDADATLTLDNLHTLVPAFTGRATGSAHLSGKPSDPRFAFRLDAKDVTLPAIRLPAPMAHTLRVPMADWYLAGDATLRDAELSDAHTVDAGFAIAGRGHVGWAQGVEWDLASNIGAFPLADFAPDLFFPTHGGIVSGPFATRGVLRAQLEALTIDTRLTGTFDELPLAVDATLDWTPARLRLETLHLAHGGNRVIASGALNAERVALTLDADAPALEASLRDFSGRLQAHAQVDGTRLAPDADIDIQAGGLRWRDLALDALTASLRLANGAFHDSTLQLHAQGVTRYTPGTRAGTITSRQLDSIDIGASGTRDRHRVDVALATGPLALALGVDGSVGDGAGWDETAWNGTLAHGSVDLRRWHWEAVGAPPLAWRPAARAGAVSQLEVAPHCWTDSTARFCLNAPAHLGSRGDVSLEAFHLPLESLLADLLPLDTVIYGRVGGMLSARWDAGTLTALDADLRNADPLRVTLVGDGTDDLRDVAQVDTLAARAHLADGAWHADATLAGTDAGNLQARLDATPATPAGGTLALDGHLRVEDLRVGLLEAFTYQVHHLGGTVGADLALTGTSSAPRAAGTVALHDGRLSFTRLPLTIDDLDLDGTFDGNRLRLAGSLHTPDSPGRARIGGTLVLGGDGAFGNLGGDWHGDATLTGDRLAVAMLPQYQFMLAPDLHLAVNPREIAVTGNIRVPSGRIELKRLPVQSVSRSGDVILVHADDTATDAGGGLGIRQRVDINLLLGRDINFRAFGGEGLLTGDLRVRSTPQLPLLVDGELHVQDGKYRALGQVLTLKQADIIFNGPADQPLVDALAVRTIDDAAVREVGLRLSGSLRAPQTVLYSSPELPPEEALSWLTTGRPLAAGPIDLRGEAAQTAISMGVAQGGALLSQAVGLQDVQLATTGDGEKAEVQVGTNLNERIYVGYNRRVFTGEGSVMLRLQMTRRLVLEALSGIESALDVFYTFEF